MPDYNPPFSLTNKILTLVAKISEALGRLTSEFEQQKLLRLRKVNRMRTVQGSLAIEGNTLSEQQITAMLDGKRVIAPPKEVQEAHNAIAAYEEISKWQPGNGDDLLAAHLLLMKGLVEDAGMYRNKGVGVMSGDKVVHMAPQADRVPKLMQALLAWLSNTDTHLLIASCVFHYEFEFIHPFSDGNGRTGRLWQTLILSKWHEVFVNIPVESLVHQHQEEYYLAIRNSTKQTDSSPFIEFMLRMILDAIEQMHGNYQEIPQEPPHVTPQVKQLLLILNSPKSREDLQRALGLKDRKSFRALYLKPALAMKLIEMTIPDKPNSKLQQYRITQLGDVVKDNMVRNND